MDKFRTTTLLAVGLSSAAGIGFALADESGMFKDFELTPFQSQTLEVAVATEKANGHKMNVVKLKNGHMMVLVDADKYMALMFGAPNTYMVP